MDAEEEEVEVMVVDDDEVMAARQGQGTCASSYVYNQTRVMVGDAAVVAVMDDEEEVEDKT
jgi:hypothetical protein